MRGKNCIPDYDEDFSLGLEVFSIMMLTDGQKVITVFLQIMAISACVILKNETDSIRQCQTVPNSIRQHQTVPDSIRQCWTVPNSVGQCLLLTDNLLLILINYPIIISTRLSWYLDEVIG